MHKSLFSKYIRAGAELAPDDVEPSDRVLTPANGMTASRPILAGIATKMLLTGQRPVTPVVFLMGASDAEGNLARFIDKHFPESGLGTSKIGAEWDPIADSAAVLMVGAACLVAPRVPVLAKVGVASALGQEGFKAVWALRQNAEYSELAGSRLVITPTLEGKASMAEKLSAIGTAVLASDFDNAVLRQGLGAGSLYFGVTGAFRAESQRQEYVEIAEQMIASLQTPN